jgi:hypothetical protein
LLLRFFNQTRKPASSESVMKKIAIAYEAFFTAGIEAA